MIDSSPMDEDKWKALNQPLELSDETVERHMKAVIGMAGIFQKWREEHDRKTY